MLRRPLQLANHVRLVDVDGEAWMIGLCILVAANCILIGYETDHGLKWSDELELAFNLTFATEMAIRLNEKRMEFFYSECGNWKWNLFDLAIVLSGLAPQIASLIFFRRAEATQSSSVVNVFRCARIIRLFRLLRIFRELSTIAEGFLKALHSVAWISITLSMFVFVCAIVITRVLGHTATKGSSIEIWFGTVEASMLTLFEMVTLDGWADIATEVGETNGWLWGPFFACFVLLTSYIFLALITAVITDQTIQALHEDHETKARELEEQRLATLEVLMHMFYEDGSGSGPGEMTEKDLTAVLQDRHNRILLRSLGWYVCEEDIQGLFNLLDVDASGSISVQEFSKGFCKLQGDAKAKDLFEHHIEAMRGMAEVSKQLQELRADLGLGPPEFTPRSPFRQAFPRKTAVSPITPRTPRRPNTMEVDAEGSLLTSLRSLETLRGDRRRLQRLLAATAEALAKSDV